MSLAIMLFAVLLLIVALVVWQHAQREGPKEVTFGIANAVSFITPRLEANVRTRLGRDGVKRIVEWEIFYLQGLAQGDRRQPVETVAGDYGPAVDFVVGEIARVHDRAYSSEDVGAVLALSAAYLQSIGAIGEQAGGLGE